MEYHHDSALQMNLCLKELELENLLFHRDPHQGRFVPEAPHLNTGIIQPSQGPKREIHFQNFHYKVFQESHAAQRQQLRQQVPKRETFQNAAPISYPDDVQVENLRSVLPMNCVIKARRPSVYEIVVRKLKEVKFYLRDLAKQREKLMTVVRPPAEDDYSMYSRMEKEEELPSPCCSGELHEDFALIIQLATEAIQSSTMETNMYRGMILMISNNCESFDSYSSMTTRVMLREFEECIDDVVMILNEFIGVHQSLEKFEDFHKQDDLLASVESLITCIRSCASYTWAMESKCSIKSPQKDDFSKTQEKYRDINIGSV